MTLVQAMQIICGIVWCGPLVQLAPSFIRVFTDRGELIDKLRVPFFLNAVAQVGSSVRWLIWPHAIVTMGSTEQSYWAALYTLSSVVALASMRVHAIGRKLV